MGEDPRRPEYLWEKVYQQTYYHGRKGILLACLSGVDIALWDILGKSMDQPLWRVFGGFGKPLAGYALRVITAETIRWKTLPTTYQEHVEMVFTATR